MQYPWWRRLLLVVPLCVGGGVFVFVASNKEPPKQKPVSERPHITRVITTAETAVFPKALGYGTVKAARIWNVVARVGGEIEYIHPLFKKGAILEAGTELVRISPKD